MAGRFLVGTSRTADLPAANEEAFFGSLTYGPCVTLDDYRLLVWPAGTRWDERRLEAVLPDGRAVSPGAVVSGVGTSLTAAAAADLEPSLASLIDDCGTGTGTGGASYVVLFRPGNIRVGTGVGADGPLVVGDLSQATGGDDALISGVVARNGRCVTIGDDVLPVWPTSTTWDEATDEIVLEDGRRVPIGATITATGGHGPVVAPGRPARVQVAIDSCAEAGPIASVATLWEVTVITPP